jgi:DNA-binding response OmpR family regulator
LKPALRRFFAKCLKNLASIRRHDRGVAMEESVARVLVIDDEPAIREGLRALLQQQGHAVTAAGDGRAGLRHLAENEVDLVITDIVMPRQDGIETIVALRRLHPDVGILAISAGVGLERGDYLSMARKLGAHCTLAKPFSPAALLDAVTACLNRATPRNAPPAPKAFGLRRERPAQQGNALIRRLA